MRFRPLNAETTFMYAFPRLCLNQNSCEGGNGLVAEAHILMTSTVLLGLLPASIISFRNAAHLFVRRRLVPV